MTHGQYRDSLGPWLDGELTPETSSAVAEHVGTCAACRAAVDEIRGLSASLRGLPRHELPDDLKARMLRPAETGSPRAPLRRPWAIASFAAAAVVLIVAIGVIGLRRPEAPQVAHLDMNEEQSSAAEAAGGRIGSTSAQREPAPAQGGDAAKVQSGIAKEEALPQPTRQNAEAFSPSPPAAPVDLPSSRDEAAAGPATADAEGDAAKVQSSVASEAHRLSREAMPPTELKKSSLDPAVAPRAGEKAGSLEDSPLTYVARLVVDPNGAYRLEQIEPPPASDAKDKGAVQDRAAGMSAGAVSPEPSGAPAAVSESARADDARPETVAPPPARLVFLVQLDAEGTITSAQLVGARTVAQQVADAARALLVGTRFPGKTMGRFSNATVQVLVPDPRPAR